MSGEFKRLTSTGIAPALTSCCLFSSVEMGVRNTHSQRQGPNRTGVCHVEECASCVALHPHVLRTCQPSEGDKRSGLGDLRLVVICSQFRALGPCTRHDTHTMSCEVSYASDGVALDLYIRAQHLSDEWFKASELHDEQLVIGWRPSVNARVHRFTGCTYCLRPGFPTPRSQPVGPRCHGCQAGREWDRECPDRRDGLPSQ